MKKILIIQTAFLGDVILATSIIEKIFQYIPNVRIDILIRKGNEPLFFNHPFLNKVYVWDKKQNKLKNLLVIAKAIRREKYDYVINMQRFFLTGLITAFSNAKITIGFDKNPLSLFFTKRIRHQINTNGKNYHETERNDRLIYFIDNKEVLLPKLYPHPKDEKTIKQLTEDVVLEEYYTISPASVWFTKALPINKWVEICDAHKRNTIYIIGSKNDFEYCEKIKNKSINKKIRNLAGNISLLQTCVLMKNAIMNYTNDSAPLHLCSAMNANVTAFFCSTIPEFGFTPTSDNSTIAQIDYKLDCRPCGLHGKTKCPKKHFRCANDIEIKNYL